MAEKIVIQKSSTADTRTCDWSKVSKDQLLASSKSHISDVKQCMRYLCGLLDSAAAKHDRDKVTPEGLAQFHADFATGFEQTTWWDNHRKINRHHLNEPDGVRDDVDLVDLVEHAVDCATAGMARSGKVYINDLPPEVLQKAFRNTIEKLAFAIKVEDPAGG